MPKDLIIQQILEADESQFSELMDRSFSVPKGQSYLDDFPVWRGRTPEILKMGAYDGKKLVAAACVRIADLWAKEQKQLLVGLIGAVATHENYRGRGIAKNLVSLASDWAANRGAALSALWGSEHELYAKIGFYPCGEQVRVQLSGLNKKTETIVQQGWNPALFQTLQNRKSGVALRKLDSLWIQEQKNVKWFWTGPKEAPTAYAALGRGIDLPHMVHEWGGKTSDLLPLLARIAEIDPLAELLGGPAVFQKAGIQFDPAFIEYLCLAKILDAGAILRTFSNSSSIKKNLAPEDLPRFLFGPPLIGEDSRAPFPLWFWGLDAV